MITDNTFTADELEAVLTANPDLLAQVTPVLTKREITVLDKVGKTAYDSQLETAIVGRKTSEIAQQVEKLVKDTTGIEKATPDEKWTSYYERALKSTNDLSKSQKEELDALKSKSTLSEAERDRMTQLGDMVKNKNTEIENLKTAHQTELNQLKIGNKIISEVAPVAAKRNALIPERVFNMAHEDAVAKMSKMALVDETNNKIIYKGADQKTMIDAAGNYKTTSDVYTELMKDLLDETKIVTGAGGEGVPPADTGLPATIKTQPALSTYLTSLGHIPNSPKYNELWTKHKGSTLPRA